MKLFQRKVAWYANQPGDAQADFQQHDPEGQAITTTHIRPQAFRRFRRKGKQSTISLKIR